MRAEDGLGGEIVDDVLRVVLDHRDLLEHDLALGVDVGERRREDHVGHHVEGDVDVVVGDARVDDRRLTRGGRVQLAAHRVEQLGDLDGAVALRALEQQVLDEVRDTRARGRLVARAGADPEADRGRADAVDVLGDDALPARQRRQSVLIHARDRTRGRSGRRQPSGAERTRPRRGPPRCRRSSASRLGVTDAPRHGGTGSTAVAAAVQAAKSSRADEVRARVRARSGRGGPSDGGRSAAPPPAGSTSSPGAGRGRGRRDRREAGAARAAGRPSPARSARPASRARRPRAWRRA